MPEYNRKKKPDGTQKRRGVSFYDEISQPYYEHSSRSSRKYKTTSNINRNSTKKSYSQNRNLDGARNYDLPSANNSSSKYLVSNLLTSPNEKKISSSFIKFYVIAAAFILLCILSAILFSNCAADLNKQDEQINDDIEQIESELDSRVVKYNQTLSQNVYNELDEESYPKVLSTISELDSSENTVSYTGSKQPSQDNKDKLEAEVVKITETDDVDLSFCAIDIYSQSCVYYNIDQKGKTFSSIKGPFLSADACQIDGFVTKHEEELYQAIKYSENNPYDTLWKKYGTSYMQNWLNELNISDSLEGKGYPEHFRVRSMTKLWAKMFMEFNHNEKIASFVADFTHTKNSAIDLELGEDYYVQSKAGWGDGTKNYTGTNDCGIVYKSLRPYILCIFSGYNNHPSKLQDLVRCIDNCHNDIMQ